MIILALILIKNNTEIRTIIVEELEELAEVVVITKVNIDTIATRILIKINIEAKVETSIETEEIKVGKK